MTISEAMKAIAVGEEIGIGAAVAAGTRERDTKNADSSFKEGMDMICQGGLAGWWSCWWSWFGATKELSTRILNRFK